MNALRLDEVKKILELATQPPATQIANRRAPASPTIQITPETAGEYADSVHWTFRNLKHAAALAQLYTTMTEFETRKRQGRETSFDVCASSETLQAISDRAEDAQKAMFGPMQGSFDFKYGSSTAFRVSTTKHELHAQLTREAFKGFNLSEDAIAQVSTILANITDSFRSLEVPTPGPYPTVDYLLKVLTAPLVKIWDDDPRSLMRPTPMMTLISLKIDPQSWRDSVYKTSERFDFSMTYAIHTNRFDNELFASIEPRMEQVFEYLGSNLGEYGAKLVSNVTASSLNAR